MIPTILWQCGSVTNLNEWLWYRKALLGITPFQIKTCNRTNKLTSSIYKTIQIYLYEGFSNQHWNIKSINYKKNDEYVDDENDEKSS